MDKNFKKLDDQWKLEAEKVNEWLSLQWKNLKKTLKTMLDWYLYYKPKNKFDKTWHLLEIIIVDIILLRVFNRI